MIAAVAAKAVAVVLVAAGVVVVVVMAVAVTMPWEWLVAAVDSEWLSRLIPRLRQDDVGLLEAIPVASELAGVLVRRSARRLRGFEAALRRSSTGRSGRGAERSRSGAGVRRERRSGRGDPTYGRFSEVRGATC